MHNEYFDENPLDKQILSATFHAPSAHNTQPWHVDPLENHTYDLYHTVENTPEPKQLVTYLNAGALVETMSLEAQNHGMVLELEPVLEMQAKGRLIGRAVLRNAQVGEPLDPLSAAVTERTTNRNRYSDTPLTDELTRQLDDLGNVLVPPAQVADFLGEATRKAWRDPEFVTDLSEWMRSNNEAEDGITPGPFNLPLGARHLVKLAAHRHGFKSEALRGMLAANDVKSFSNAPAAAVLEGGDDQPLSLFNAGRRLLRSWVTITGSDYDYHPFSAPVFDDEVRPKLAKATGLDYPVGFYRVGKAVKPQAIPSHRRPLDDFLEK